MRDPVQVSSIQMTIFSQRLDATAAFFVGLWLGERDHSPLSMNFVTLRALDLTMYLGLS